MKTPTSPERASLLVVDDEEGLLFLISDVLRREGYEVTALPSGREALEWLRSHSPDLLLLDLNLGDLSAPALMARLRDEERFRPFIVITGCGDERVAVDVMKNGALDYVMKDRALLDLLPSVVRRALTTVERERRLAEADEAIRDREQRSRKIILTALDGFFRMDARGQFMEVNEAFCNLLRYSPEELVGMSGRDIDAGGDGGVFAECIRRRAEAGYRCQSRLRRRDRVFVDVDISMRRDGEEIFGFVHDLSEQRRLEREVLEISEDERRRIGRDLHDGLGQQLTALELMSHTLARQLKNDMPELARTAEEISAYTRSAIAQARQLAHGLAPVALEAEGLMAALNDLACLTNRTGVACDFECPALIQFHDLAVATHLYRIAQEAVNNALKHAQARQIVLRLEDDGFTLDLSIEDDGIGFSSNGKAKIGMGLQVLEYRAKLIGGRLEVGTNRGQGVRVLCSLPK